MRLHSVFIITTILFTTQCRAQSLKNYYEGVIKYQHKEWKIAVEFTSGDSNKISCMVHFLEIDAYNRQFTVTYIAPAIKLERQQPDGRPSLIFDGKINGDSISGYWEGIGIKNAGFVLKPAHKIKYIEKEIEFGHDSIQLSGTLLLPDKKEKFPFVVFMHGGAPEDRNVYYGIAQHFLQKGIGALIYDKRGVGKSTGGDWRTAGVSGLASDALTAIRLLKQRTDIDSNRIGVFGHSEGGWTAPMAAVLSRDVKFVIASGASAVNATEQSVHHRANIMRQQGFDEKAVATASAIRVRLNTATRLCYTDTAKAIIAIKNSIKEIEAVKNEPWLSAAALPLDLYPGCPVADEMELLFADPVQTWQQVKVPVYLAWGSDDIVVPVAKRSLITGALARAGNKHVNVKFHQGVDHFMMQTNTSGEWDFPRQSPAYFDDMADWVLRLIG